MLRYTHTSNMCAEIRPRRISDRHALDLYTNRTDSYLLLLILWFLFGSRFKIILDQLGTSTCKGAKLQGGKVARVQSCKGAKLQKYKNAKIQKCKDARMQGCKGARVQGCKSARVQGCKGDGRVVEWGR